MHYTCYSYIINSNILEMIRQELVRFNDELYLLKAKYPQEKIRVDKTQELKDLLKCDIVLKQNGWLFCCEKIEELEVLSE